MPTLLTEAGLRFFFYSNEHEPKHVHVIKGDDFAKIEIKTLAVVTNCMKSKDLKKAVSITEANQAEFERRWNTLIKGKTVRFDDRHLSVELEDGRVISTPMAWYKELQSAPFGVLKNYQFICRGTGIEWPDLDYQLSIESMLVAVPAQQAA